MGVGVGDGDAGFSNASTTSAARDGTRTGSATINVAALHLPALDGCHSHFPLPSLQE